MYDTFKIMAVVFFSVSGIFLLLAVILGIKFKIFKVIGDVSGRNAKKSIEKIKNDSRYKSPDSKTLRKKQEIETTEKLLTKEDSKGETSLLDDDMAAETDLLEEDSFMETSLLSDINSYTEELATPVNKEPDASVMENFKIIENIVMIHTNEVI